MRKNKKNALIIFIKAPRFGEVKTRLQPDLMVEESLLFYRAMVEDLINQLGSTAFCDVKIFFTPPDAEDEIKTWLGPNYEFYSQKGNDLGERMSKAMAEIFKQDYKKVVLIGSDIPTIDTTTIVRAFSNLDNYDIVLGPSKDGGYYLVGSKKAQPGLFQDIFWSTSFVLGQTIQKARKLKLEVVQIEIKSDIDTYGDVVELWRYLKKRNVPGKFNYKSETYSVLKKLFSKKRVLEYL